MRLLEKADINFEIVLFMTFARCKFFCLSLQTYNFLYAVVQDKLQLFYLKKSKTCNVTYFAEIFMPFLYQKSTIKQLFFLIHYFPRKFRCVEKHAAAVLAQFFFICFLTVIRLLFHLFSDICFLIVISDCYTLLFDC